MLSVKHVIMVTVRMSCSKGMLEITKLPENSRSWLCMSEASPGGPDSFEIMEDMNWQTSV